MKNLFTPSERQQILDRLAKLQPGATRQWGKMDPAQMLAHCARALEVGAGDTPRTQGLLGKILAGFVKKKVLGEAPFGKNAPTDPAFVVSGACDFAREKEHLVALVSRFGAAGAAEADGRVHSFFGRLTGDEWGVLMHKHLDHHLRQFGA